QRHGNDAKTAEFDRALYLVRDELRDAAALLQRALEHVEEASRDGAPGFGVPVARHRSALELVEGAEVVEAEDVIRMGMREQHRVNTIEPVGQRLLPQIDRRIDEDAKSIANL